MDAFGKGHTALMPYYTLGFPNYEVSLSVIQSCVLGGADLMELGIPFSDPLTDGPTIQYSTQVALQNGMTVGRCIAAVRSLREMGIQVPFLLMGSCNPLLAYGLKRFVKEVAESGANGLIVPDLPPEEASELSSLCSDHGVALVHLVAPNSTEDRIELIAGRSTGLVYLVSVTGITGARDTLPTDLEEFVKRVRARTCLPLALGFGVSTPDQAHKIGQITDGVIVGSALIEAVRKALAGGKDPAGIAGTFVAEMRKALRSWL